MIFVDGENATFADPCGPLTSIVVPDTESIDPLTSSSPLTFDGDGGDATVDVVFGAVDVSLGEPLSDEPQATADSAVIPTTVSTE